MQFANGAAGPATFTVKLGQSGQFNVGSGATLSVLGALDLNAKVLTLAGSGTQVYSGTVSGGAGSIVLNGAGILTLSGANNFTGGVTVNAGTLRLGANTTGTVTSGPLGTGTLSLVGGTVSSDSTTARNLANAISIGGNVTLGSATQTGTLTFTGTTNTLTGSRTLTLNSAAAFTGSIGESSAGFSLTKNGTGTLTFNAGNTYTGATKINSGTLALGATGDVATSSKIGIGTSAVLDVSAKASGYSVATGKTLEGVGSISVASGQKLTIGGASTTISPGTVDTATSTIGTLTISGGGASGGLTLGGGGKYEFTLDNVTGTAGTNWDLISLASQSIVQTATSGSKFTINVGGLGTGFSSTSNYTWAIASMGSFGTFDATGFAITGSNFGGTGTFSIANTGTALNLVYTAPALTGFTWTGAGPNTLWSTAANWGGTAPTAGLPLTFAGFNNINTNNDYAANTVFAGITFDSTAGSFILNGNTVDLSGDVTNNSTSFIIINLGMRLSGAGRTFTAATSTLQFYAVDNNGFNLTFAGSGINELRAAGVINGSGGLIKNGNNTATLYAANNFTGATTVNNGTLAYGVNDALGSGAVSIAGGILNLDTFSDTVGSFAITSGTLAGSGTLTAATYALSGGTINANLGTGTATAATGTTALNGTLAGDLTVSGGTVNLGSANRLGDSSAVSISSGTLGLSSFNDTVGSFAITGGFLNGPGTLTAATYSLGGGTVNASLGSGAATASSGTTTLNGNLAGSLGLSGTATVNLGTGVGIGGNVTVGGTSALGLGTSTGIFGDVTVSGGTLTYGASHQIGNTSAVLLSSGTIALGTNSDTVGSFAMSGGSLTGSTGVLTASTYDLQGGSISAKLGAGAVTVSNGTTTLSTTGRLDSTSSLTVNSGQLTIAPGGTETVNSYTQTGGTISGGTLSSATDYNIQAGAISSNLTGGVGFVKTTNGAATLSGTANYVGFTAIREGSLQLLGDNRLPTFGTTVLGDTSTTGKLILGTGATASNQTLAGLSTAFNTTGSSVVGGASVISTVTINATAASTYNGKLGGAGANEDNVALTKTGSATVTLGASNTYTGGTTISAGTLQLSASSALGTGAVTMSAGSILASAATTHSNDIVIGTAAGTGAALAAGWDFSTITSGNAGTSPFAATNTAANLTVGGLTRASGIATTGSPGGNGFYGTAFTVGATNTAAGVTANEFVTFTLTSTSGTLSLDSIDPYNIRRSSTGPSTGQWQYQIGAGTFVDIGAPITWGGTTNAAGNAQVSIDLSGIASLQNIAQGTTVTIRVVPYGASNAGGTWYLNDPLGTNALDLVINKSTATAATGSGILGISEAGSTTFSGAITVHNTAELTAVSGGTATFSGAINGAGSITKTDSGTVILGSANSYTGGTTITGGTLVASNTSGSATGSGPVAVNSGATLTGDGAIAGAVTVNGSGTLLGNDNVITSLETGNLTLTSGSTTYLELSTGISFDKITSTGTVAFGGNLALELTGPFDGQTFDLFDFTSESGTFSSITATGYSSDQISFNYGTGEVSFSAPIPEPATVIGVLGLVGLVGYRERRRFGKLLKRA